MYLKKNYQKSKKVKDDLINFINMFKINFYKNYSETKKSDFV